MASLSRVLVCDLDETVVCSSVDPSYFDYRTRDFTFENVLFFKRPHVDDMLLHAQALGFRFVVFTAATADYAAVVVKHVFVALGITPLAIFSRQHCIIRHQLNPQGNHFDQYAIKPLMQLWNQLRIHLHDVLLLDDKVCSAQYDPMNLFHITPFTGDFLGDEALLHFKRALSFIHQQTHLKTMHALQLYLAIQHLPVSIIHQIAQYF